MIQFTFTEYRPTTETPAVSRSTQLRETTCNRLPPPNDPLPDDSREKPAPAAFQTHGARSQLLGILRNRFLTVVKPFFNSVTKHLPTPHTVQTGFVCSRGSVVKVRFHFQPVNLGFSSTVTRLSQRWSHRGYLN